MYFFQDLEKKKDFGKGVLYFLESECYFAFQDSNMPFTCKLSLSTQGSFRKKGYGWAGKQFPAMSTLHQFYCHIIAKWS